LAVLLIVHQDHKEVVGSVELLEEVLKTQVAVVLVLVKLVDLLIKEELEEEEEVV
jgi:hypothetical protein